MDALSMKSSRRKQSKPIRVSYDENADPGGVLQTVPPKGTELGYVNGNGMDVDEAEHEKDKMDVDTALDFSKPSGEKVSAYKPVNSSKNELDHSENHVNADKSDAFPTAYHRLGSEFLHNNIVPNGENEQDAMNSMEKEAQDMSGSDSKAASGEVSKSNGNRIFHQDAYCDLCDKEFCNRYFLKTHKANKHGIYDNSSSPFQTSGNPLHSSMIVPQDSFPNNPFKMCFDLPPTSQPVPAQVQQPSASRSASPSPPAQPPPSASQQQTTKPSAPMPSLTPSTLAPSLNSSKPKDSTAMGNGKPTGQDMEDFCEICQKHFCNKYYLKKHKNDVHGIAPPESSPSIGKRGGRPPNLEIKLPVSSAADTSNPLIPHSLASMPGLQNMPGVMVLNPFLPPVLIPAQSLLSQSQLPPPPHLPVISSTMSSSSHHPNAHSPPAISTIATSSTSSGSLPNDGFRSMGGFKGEAFCDICRKEFCNIYFLRIHQANKHGIFFDNFPMSMSSSMTSENLPSKSQETVSDTSETKQREREKDDYQHLKENVPDSSPKAATTPVSQPANSDTFIGTFCNICNQEFANKYLYRVHRIQAHGLYSEAFSEAELAEEVMKMHDLPKSMNSRVAEELAMMERGGDIGFSTMFGSLVAAKLADRVTCDICNKELCNKYFLKAHKQKVHGIETTNTEKSPKQQTDHILDEKNSSIKQDSKDSLMSSPKSDKPVQLIAKGNLSASMDLIPGPVVEKPSPQELVKLGIDPMAYCEICKKEFCSKYFLKTHKQNIHGIRTDKLEPSDSSKFSSSYKNSFMNSPMSVSFMNSFTMPPMSLASNMSMNSTSVSMSNGNNLNVNNSPQMAPMNLSVSTGKSKNGFEKHTWRWKEPVNSSRVICEICNKELCNKYFMRTHKLNKHGILPNDKSPSPKMSSQNIVPNASDADTSSNSSLPTDLSVREKTNQSPFQLKFDERITGNAAKATEDDHSQFEALNLKIKSEDDPSHRYYNHYTEICHLCDRRFKSTKWLKAHILKDHAGLTALSPTMERAFHLSGAKLAPLQQRTCPVCSIVFPNEMSMQLHMIQEHNAQVTIKTDSPTSNGDVQGKISGTSQKYPLKRHFSAVLKQKYYSCAVCMYKTKWLSNILKHEKKMHGSKQMLQENLQGNFDDNEQWSGTTFKKVFRCISCSRVFPSPVLCHLHIRQDHIRKKSFKVNNKLPSCPYSCSHCKFSTRFPKQLKRHVIRSHRFFQGKENILTSGIEDFNSGNTDLESSISSVDIHAQPIEGDKESYVMQTFKIQECDRQGMFVTSVVEMPVYQRLQDSTAVSFLVTPLEQ
ncbi:hypothetical protein ACJMK2_041487 [Sinanodonta woodiana]|uniref:C2H2-type domain-containing protein n=1 Tax=Sinanodonta woodiana TaxID=1069815 RepID=A0ABD3W7L0_SINWO